MAENKEIVVKLTLDTKGAEQATQSVEQNLKEIEDSLKDIGSSGATDGLTQQMQKLNAVVDNQNLTWGEAGKAIEQYQNIALAAGSTSPVGQEAIKRAGQLKQEVDTLTRSIDVAAQKGKVMQGALAIGSTVTAGYGAMQGVMALAGQESEVLMNSLVKMQAAQSVLAGIEQLRVAVEKEGILMMTLKTAQTKIATAAQAAYATVVGTTTGGLKLLRLALVSTGIGAIIVGLGLLIANFDKVTMAVKWAYNQVIELWYGFQELGTGVKILLSIMFPFVGVIWAVTEALQAMGVVETVEQRKTREAIEAKMKVATAAHNKRVAEIHAQIKVLEEAREAEKAAIASVIKELDRELELRRAAGLETKDIEEAKLTALIQSARQQYNISKSIMEMQDAELFSRRQHNIELQKIQGKNTEQLEKALDFEKRQRALIIEENLAAEKDALDQALHNLKVFQISAETERKNANKKEKEDAIKNEDEIKRIYDRRVDNIKVANKEAETSSYEYYRVLGEMAKKQADEQARLDKEALDRKLANIDAVDARAEQGATFLSDLNAVFSKDSEKEAKREFQINKARDLAGAVTNTAKGVTQALASAPPPISFVNAGIVGALGAANIARIAKTKFGSASSGGGSVSIPSVSSGGANGGTGGQVQQNDNLTNIAQLLNQQPRPVLVVDSFNKVDREAEKIKTVASI